MKGHKLAIMAVQETHLDNDMLLSITNCFGKRLTIINSKLPERPRTSAGVAFVINRALIAPRDLEITELIEGHALAIKFKWHNKDDVLLLNIYAPNNRNEHPAFWETIDTKRRSKGLRCPDLMLGEFNLTEENIDRTPAHLDDVSAITALRNLRQCLGIEDTWRHAFPHDRCFTYQATTGNRTAIKARLDRIYTSENASKALYDWKFSQMSVPTDHWMVSVKYAPNHAPYLGKGCWTMQILELKNDDLMKHIIERSMTLQSDIKGPEGNQLPENTNNPQSLWAEFKNNITKITKDHCSKTRAKLTKKIKAMEHNLKNLAKNPNIDIQ